MDEVKYFEADQNLKNEQGLSAEEKINLDSVLKTRASLVQQLASSDSDFEAIIQQIENLPNSTDSENVRYELDYLWEQEDISHILDAYNERSKPNGKEDSYGVGELLPWFLGTSKRNKGEQRDGVSTMVVTWMQDKVSKGEDIDLSFQDTLATWTQNIHMAKIDRVLSLLNKDKINPGVLAGRLKSDIMASLSFYDSKGHYSNLLKNIALSKESSFEEVSQAINFLIFFNRHGDTIEFEDSGNYAGRALEDVLAQKSEYFFRILITSTFSDERASYKQSKLMLPEITTLNGLFTFQYLPDGNFLVTKKDLSTGIPKNVSLQSFMEDSATPDEEITEQLLLNYKTLLDARIRSNVESKIGFSLSSLDVPAQIAFLDFLSRTSEDEINNFSTFLNKYEKEDRVAVCSCYLVFSKEKDFSYMVERLCSHEGIGLPLARHVSKLVGNAQEIKGFLQKEFKTSYEKKNISRVHEKLIKRAYDLFLKYNSEVFSLETIGEIESGHNLMEDMDDDLAEELGFNKGGQGFGERASYKETRDQIARKVEEDCNAELFSQTLFINSFKTLHESGTEFSLEDIESSKLEQSEGGAITESDISVMRSIYSHNQKESAVHDALLTSFNKKVKDPKTRFNIFKWQDKIQSFVAFSDKGDSLYMSAFNVSPDARGYKIGEAMLDQVVEQEAKESTLTADCDSKLPISAKYIETGWVGTFYWEDKNEKEQKSDWVLDIKRDETANNSYWGKSQNKESIITQRTHPENVKVEVAKTQAELPFQLCTKGFVLTRMFKDEGSGLYYGVFELPNKKETTHE